MTVISYVHSVKWGRPRFDLYSRTVTAERLHMRPRTRRGANKNSAIVIEKVYNSTRKYYSIELTISRIAMILTVFLLLHGSSCIFAAAQFYSYLWWLRKNRKIKDFAAWDFFDELLFSFGRFYSFHWFMKNFIDARKTARNQKILSDNSAFLKGDKTLKSLKYFVAQEKSIFSTGYCTLEKRIIIIVSSLLQEGRFHFNCIQDEITHI